MKKTPEKLPSDVPLILYGYTLDVLQLLLCFIGGLFNARYNITITSE